jgi:hypothetical protein
MPIDQIRQRALEAQHATMPKPKTKAPVVADPDDKAPAPESREGASPAKPRLSQVELERANDEGMLRPDGE